LDCPHWPDAYGNWLRRERMRVLKAWAAQRQLAARTVTTDEWLRAKQSWVYRGEVGNVLPQAMRGLAGALVAARLAAAGLKLRYWAMADAPIELLADLECLIWAGMNLCAGPLAAALDRPAEMAAIFERGSGLCADTLHGHVLSLRSLARRVLDG